MEITRTENSALSCFSSHLLPYLNISHNDKKYTCCFSYNAMDEENFNRRKKVTDILNNLSKEDKETLLLLEIEFREMCMDSNVEKRIERVSLIRDFWELHGGDPELWAVLLVRGPHE